MFHYAPTHWLTINSAIIFIILRYVRRIKTLQKPISVICSKINVKSRHNTKQTRGCAKMKRIGPFTLKQQQQQIITYLKVSITFRVVTRLFPVETAVKCVYKRNYMFLFRVIGTIYY